MDPTATFPVPSTSPKSRKRGEFRGVANLGGRSVSLHEFNGRCRVSSSDCKPVQWPEFAPAGAVMPLPRPSEEPPMPRMTLKISSSSRMASCSIASTPERLRLLTHHEAVGSCIKGRGVRWRERPDGGKFRKGGRVHGSVGSACKHDIDLSCLQQAARIQNGGHRRGACSVHGMIGALQIQQVGNTTETTFANSPGIVSSSTRGVPSNIASVKAWLLASGRPCCLARDSV